MRHEFFSNSYLPEVNRAIGDFVSAEVFGKPGRYDKFCSMGVFQNDELIAGVLYHNYMPEYGTIEMSAASTTKRWVSKVIVRDMMTMPFERLGCQCVIARHDDRRRDLRRIWTRMGAGEYLIPRLRGRDNGEAVALLTEESWLASDFVKVRELAHV